MASEWTGLGNCVKKDSRAGRITSVQSGAVLSSTSQLPRSGQWSCERLGLTAHPRFALSEAPRSAAENDQSLTLHLPSVSKLPKTDAFLRAFLMTRINAAHCYVTESKRLPNFPSWTSRVRIPSPAPCFHSLTLRVPVQRYDIGLTSTSRSVRNGAAKEPGRDCCPSRAFQTRNIIAASCPASGSHAPKLL
jgi:hypothetical protein